MGLVFAVVFVVFVRSKLSRLQLLQLLILGWNAFSKEIISKSSFAPYFFLFSNFVKDEMKYLLSLLIYRLHLLPAFRQVLGKASPTAAAGGSPASAPLCGYSTVLGVLVSLSHKGKNSM